MYFRNFYSIQVRISYIYIYIYVVTKQKNTNDHFIQLLIFLIINILIFK